jgi:hypothetical protein
MSFKLKSKLTNKYIYIYNIQDIQDIQDIQVIHGFQDLQDYQVPKFILSL